VEWKHGEEGVIAMIGALLMQKTMSKNQAATVNAKDIEALKKFWADDVKLTFVGQPPIEGKDAVEEWYRSWFAGIKEIRETSTTSHWCTPTRLAFPTQCCSRPSPTWSTPTVCTAWSTKSESSRSMGVRPRISGSTSPTRTAGRY
jgi:hypothetical protein